MDALNTASFFALTSSETKMNHSAVADAFAFVKENLKKLSSEPMDLSLHNEIGVLEQSTMTLKTVILEMAEITTRAALDAAVVARDTGSQVNNVNSMKGSGSLSVNNIMNLGFGWDTQITSSSPSLAR